MMPCYLLLGPTDNPAGFMRELVVRLSPTRYNMGAASGDTRTGFP